MFFSFTEISGNRKTGPISVSKTSGDSCPTSCGVYFECYGRNHWSKIHWDRLNRGEGSALTFEQYLHKIRRKAQGIWRHGEVGGLPGKGNKIDREKLQALTGANKAAKASGFAYAAEPMFAGNYRVCGKPDQIKKGKISEALAANNRQAIKEANEGGFVINLSSTSLAQADKNCDLKIAPVVTILPSDAKTGIRYYTPNGRKVVTCPNTVLANKDLEITCRTCKLCAIPNRKSILGFPAHGTFKTKINRRLQALDSNLRAD